MEHFELIRQLAGQWNAFSVFLQKYGMYLTAAALVFALLNCFLGYRLRKLWIVLVSFLAGSAVGLAVCIHMRLSLRWSLLAALAAGIFCALLGYLLYRAGLFILCWGVTVFLLLQLLHPASTAALAACLIAGAAAGGFALARERVTVALVTAIGGGFGSAFLLLSLAGQDSPLLTILLTAILAFLGILVQLKPWKNKDYWEQEDQNLQRENREQARRRKSRKKQKRKEKKAKRKNRRRKRREPETKQPQKTAARRAQKPAPSPSRPREYAADFKEPPVSSPPSQEPQPGPDSRNLPENSFSDIQLQLSREVSEIYKEQQSASQNGAGSAAAKTPEHQETPKDP